MPVSPKTYLLLMFCAKTLYTLYTFYYSICPIYLNRSNNIKQKVWSWISSLHNSPSHLLLCLCQILRKISSTSDFTLVCKKKWHPHTNKKREKVWRLLFFHLQGRYKGGNRWRKYQHFCGLTIMNQHGTWLSNQLTTHPSTQLSS